MKTLKLLDSLISTILLLLFIILFFTRQEDAWEGYLILGGWQLLSMFIHEVAGLFLTKGSLRHTCHAITVILLAIFCVALAGAVYVPGIGYFLFILLQVLVILLPLRSVYYTLLCFHEWKMMSKRPIAVLKNNH